MGKENFCKLGIAGFAVAMLSGVALLNGTASALTLTEDTTLEEDVTDGIVVEAGSTVTLNLNNHEVTNNASGKAAIINKGTLVITGDGTVSTEQSSTAAVTNYPGATITINGGTYTSSKWYIIRNYGQMTIGSAVNVTSYGKNQGNASMITNGWYNSGTGDSNNGEYIKITEETVSPNLVIEGGTYTAGLSNCSVVKNDEFGTLTINNGNFTQPQGTKEDCDTVILNWNEATINGGEFYSENGKVFSNNSYGVYGKGAATITGGTFTTGANGVLLGFGLDGGNSGTLHVSGGTFDGALIQGIAYTIEVTGGTYGAALNQDLIGEGYSQYQNGDNYTVARTLSIGSNDNVNDEGSSEVSSNESVLSGVASGIAGSIVENFATLTDGQEITLEDGTTATITSATNTKDAILAGNGINLNLVSEETTLDESQAAAVAGVLPSGATQFGAAEISVNLVSGDNVLGTVSTLPQALELSYDVSGINPVAEGYSRAWKVVHIHNGEAELIDATYDAESNKLYFESDSFSAFAFAYVDTKIAGDDESEVIGTPDTGVFTNQATTESSNGAVVAVLTITAFVAIALVGLAVKTTKRQ